MRPTAIIPMSIIQPTQLNPLLLVGGVRRGAGRRCAVVRCSLVVVERLLQLGAHSCGRRLLVVVQLGDVAFTNYQLRLALWLLGFLQLPELAAAVLLLLLVHAVSLMSLCVVPII